MDGNYVGTSDGKYIHRQAVQVMKNGTERVFTAANFSNDGVKLATVSYTAFRKLPRPIAQRRSPFVGFKALGNRCESDEQKSLTGSWKIFM